MPVKLRVEKRACAQLPGYPWTVSRGDQPLLRAKSWTQAMGWVLALIGARAEQRG